jgi:N-acetylglucosamine-6-phosphate deacetylase
MATSTCVGRNVFTGSPVEVRFHGSIESVTPAGSEDGLWLAPGFIDIQVNGYAGVDYNQPSAAHDAIARSLQVQFACGVTRLYPTVITGSPEQMEGSLANLARAAETLSEGAAIDGFHVEGPFISPEDGPRGAHPRQWVRPPDIGEYRRWQEKAKGRIRLITLSPEWPEAPRFIGAIVADGVVASIGHTKASPQQIAAAVDCGATLSTHLGNGAHAVMRRHPNYIWDQLAEDRLMADFIVDGIHLPAAFLKVALRAKGIERSVLVTDASTPAGAAPGRYRIGDQEVDHTPDRRVVLAGTEKLAGSALLLHEGVENLIKFAGLSLADAVRMATVNAAVAGKLPGRARGLVPGERADFVQFRFDSDRQKIHIAATWVDGRQVYRAS